MSLYLFAFINVVTGLFVWQQFVALVALAVEASRVVDAFLATLVVFRLEALVDAAEGRFVRLVGAVASLVAHLALRNALSVAALELVISTPGSIGLGTFKLVAVVSAIILTITPTNIM